MAFKFVNLLIILVICSQLPNDIIAKVSFFVVTFWNKKISFKIDFFFGSNFEIIKEFFLL